MKLKIPVSASSCRGVLCGWVEQVSSEKLYLFCLHVSLKFLGPIPNNLWSLKISHADK